MANDCKRSFNKSGVLLGVSNGQAGGIAGDIRQAVLPHPLHELADLVQQEPYVHNKTTLAAPRKGLAKENKWMSL